MQRCVGLMEREEPEMTTDSHSRSSQGSHNRKEDAKANGMRMSQEEFDREKAEIDFQIGILMKMLQKSVWTMRKRVKWPRLRERRNQQVKLEIAEELRKIEQILSAQEESEKLREAEVELEVSICRPEQGEMLGEEDNDRLAEGLLDYWQNSEQFEDMLTKEADEAMKPCDFDSYSLCMFAGCAEADGQPDEVVTRNVDLEVKYDGEPLLEEEGVDLLKQKEFIDEILFGVKQSDEVDIDQQFKDNSIVGLQKGGPVQCAVCSSQSMDFVDTHSLIMHAYNAPNPMLRSEHLGLYKALCVLMGWSYASPPDNEKSYQSFSAPEAMENTQDLILWPPLVIIQNASTGKRKDGLLEGIGNREMDAQLEELGFTGGKSKAVYGRGGHQGTIIVKFSPSSAGLQEAEQLIKYFESKNHGRKDWLRVQSSTVNQENGEENPELVETDEKTKLKKRVLYGYLAIAGDLEKLDVDTRKKALVKSKKDSDALPQSGQRLEGPTTATVIKNRLSNQVWDPGGRKPEMHDLEIMVNLNFGSLMQEHLDPASNVEICPHVVVKSSEIYLLLVKNQFTEEVGFLK